MKRDAAGEAVVRQERDRLARKLYKAAADRDRYQELVENIAAFPCVSYMLTGNTRYQDDEQRCGCVVHMARQAVPSGGTAAKEGIDDSAD